MKLNYSGFSLSCFKCFCFTVISLTTSFALTKSKNCVPVTSVNKKQLAASGAKEPKNQIIKDSVLLELKFIPYEDNIKQLLNDDIVRKFLKSIPNGVKKVYLNIFFDDNDSKPIIVDYISNLYAQLWNEAVQLNILDLEYIILCDIFENNGYTSIKDVLQLRELISIYTFNSTNYATVNEQRLSMKIPPIAIVDTNTYIKSLLNQFESNLNKIIFFHPNMRDIPQYEHVVLGGTFDRIHNGHKKLLTLAAICCKSELTIGITGHTMLQQKSNVDMISNYATRCAGVESFLFSIKPGLKLNLVELFDPFGPTIHASDLDAIIVSSETILGAFKINEIRANKKLKELDILVTMRTDSAILSSSFIRDKISQTL
eukprot:gene4407-6233_t